MARSGATEPNPEKGTRKRTGERTVGVYERPEKKRPPWTIIIAGAVVLAIILLIIFTQIGHARGSLGM